MNALVPLLVISGVSAFILLLGFAVNRAALYRPRTVSALIAVVVAAGFGVLAYVAVAAEANLAAGRWLAVGLGLVVLGCPAWVLIPSASARSDGSVNPSLGEAAKLLLGYLAACWLIGLGVAIFVHFDRQPSGVVALSKRPLPLRHFLCLVRRGLHASGGPRRRRQRTAEVSGVDGG